MTGCLQACVRANAGFNQTDFQAFLKSLGHSGNLISEKPVAEHWVEDTGEAVSITRGVGYCGLGQGDLRVQVV